MARPLMQHGVGQLEEMFVKGKADAKVLKQLEHELQYRQVPRAVALLAEVQAAMYGGATTPQLIAVPALPTGPALASIPQQPSLWERPATSPVVAPPTVVPVRAVAPAVRLPEPPPAAKPSAPSPAVPLEDANKVLKTAPGATWESIEQSRRMLVLQSHPSRWKSMSVERRAQVLMEAKRVNAAYAALSQARCGLR